MEMMHHYLLQVQHFTCLGQTVLKKGAQLLTSAGSFDGTVLPIAEFEPMQCLKTGYHKFSIFFLHS